MKPFTLAIVFLALAAFASAGVTKLENVERDRRQTFNNLNVGNCIGNVGFNSACVSSIMAAQGFAPGAFASPGFGFFPGTIPPPYPYGFSPYGVGAYPGFGYGAGYGTGFGAGYGGLGGYPSLGYGVGGIGSYGSVPDVSEGY